MIEIKYFTKTRKGAQMSDIYLRFNFPQGGTRPAVSASAKVKSNQWIEGFGCKEVGLKSQDDKTRNIRVNKKISKLKEQYYEAWDNLDKAGQKLITLDDLKQFIDGSHEKAASRDMRLTYKDAAKHWIKYKTPLVRHIAPYKAHFSATLVILEKLGKGNLTIDNFTEAVGADIVDYMVNNDWVHKGRSGTYSHAHRVQIRGTNKQLFDYFFSNRERLPFRPVLPERHPWTYVKTPQTAVEKQSDELREVHFYSEEEIEAIEKAEVNNELNYYRNALLFQIYTGVSRSDLGSFNPMLHVVDKGEGGKWITNMKRIKTGENFHVPCDDKIDRLIRYFVTHSNANAKHEVPGIINVASWTTYWFRLSKLSKIVGFKLTESHKGRHTFAMDALNEKLIPVEDLAAMIGHKDPATTMKYYAKVSLNRLVEGRKIREGKHLTITESKMTNTK